MSSPETVDDEEEEAEDPIDLEYETELSLFISEQELLINHNVNRESIKQEGVSRKDSQEIVRTPFENKICNSQRKQYSVYYIPVRSTVAEFNCSYCDYITKWKNNLTAHMSGRHRATTFKYPHCEYVRKWMRSLPVFKCNCCTYATKWKYNLTAHVSGRHGSTFLLLHHKGQVDQGPVKPETTPISKKKTESSFDIHNHRSEKVEDSLAKTIFWRHYVDLLLNATPATDFDRSNRWKNKFVPNIVAKCEQCDFVSKSKQSLALHVCRFQPYLVDRMKICYNSDGFKCIHCDYSTKFNKRLSLHMQSCHLEL
ncbi:hypothetical protein PPYR_08882 [Photinus pyralis]|uniref:C2H2-type domain-containing protein n=3 Tax=Photinus pyralis TaxID=7054 RepID=A0A5N4ABC4_PHOPY|nr:uncharacterized protein LOC116170334 [Photinus pyralis]XP_031350985.1 uncharacterized protein LOC116176521 [Photinus pyralis]KAB0794614.1 hypothetical protein PPYR_11453 [Photinus pyralis]KAB0797889.1 hypothetical protein PPYR_08882 [Photinus pyralis]